MTSWRLEFKARAQEIETYFDLLQKMESPAILEHEDCTGAKLRSQLSTDLVTTLKGAGFLLLYNLVESTMRNGITAIFDELRQRKVRFENVRNELRVVAIENIRRPRPAKFAASLQDVAADILTAAFDASDLFSGNVDARAIREVARRYGFSAQNCERGDKLLKVKTNRNDLGHGNKSFGEVGRDYGVDELVVIKDQVIKHLSDVVSNIEGYIAREEYLSAEAKSAAQHSSSVGSLIQAAALEGPLPEGGQSQGEQTRLVYETAHRDEPRPNDSERGGE